MTTVNYENGVATKGPRFVGPQHVPHADLKRVLRALAEAL